MFRREFQKKSAETISVNFISKQVMYILYVSIISSLALQNLIILFNFYNSQTPPPYIKSADLINGF